MMTADRWKAVEELFHRALDMPEKERAAFIEANCQGDPDMLREVQSLIDSDSAASTGSFAAAAVPADSRNRPWRYGLRLSRHP
jgi:eukaryotic-like serine/threonine-protein kinase